MVKQTDRLLANSFLDMVTRNSARAGGDLTRACRLFKKTFQRGRNERRGEAYSVPYVEPLSDVRTKLEDFSIAC